MSKEEEKKSPFALVYCIDGNLLKVSDFSKSLIPPPFSLYSIDAGDVIMGSGMNSSQILLITETEFKVYDYLQNKITQNWKNDQK